MRAFIVNFVVALTVFGSAVVANADWWSVTSMGTWTVTAQGVNQTVDVYDISIDITGEAGFSPILACEFSFGPSTLLNPAGTTPVVNGANPFQVWDGSTPTQEAATSLLSAANNTLQTDTHFAAGLSSMFGMVPLALESNDGQYASPPTYEVGLGPLNFVGLSSMSFPPSTFDVAHVGVVRGTQVNFSLVLIAQANQELISGEQQLPFAEVPEPGTLALLAAGLLGLLAYAWRKRK